MLKPVVYKNHNISIFNNKTLSEANASLFFIKKLCKFLQSFCFGLFHMDSLPGDAS